MAEEPKKPKTVDIVRKIQWDKETGLLAVFPGTIVFDDDGKFKELKTGLQIDIDLSEEDAD
jgi:hypothetical protein